MPSIAGGASPSSLAATSPQARHRVSPSRRTKHRRAARHAAVQIRAPSHDPPGRPDRSGPARRRGRRASTGSHLARDRSGGHRSGSRASCPLRSKTRRVSRARPVPFRTPVGHAARHRGGQCSSGRFPGVDHERGTHRDAALLDEDAVPPADLAMRPKVRQQGYAPLASSRRHAVPMSGRMRPRAPAPFR